MENNAKNLLVKIKEEISNSPRVENVKYNTRSKTITVIPKQDQSFMNAWEVLFKNDEDRMVNQCYAMEYLKLKKFDGYGTNIYSVEFKLI